MNGWLLDTNVLSEFRKRKCWKGVRTLLEGQPDGLLYTSYVTLAEIRFGIERRDGDAAFRAEAYSWLDGVLRPWFARRVVGINEDVVLIWRRMVERGRKSGYTFPQPDLFIAAMARWHQLVVVTRDVAPFVKAGVAVLNPWTQEFVSATGKRKKLRSLRSGELLLEVGRVR